MSLSPQVTITGTFEQLTGVADPTAQVVFTLVNYGDAVPTIPGTCVISELTNTATCSGGTFSITLWGNDVIVPGTTYYQVKFLSSSGDFVAMVPYLLVGSGTFDLSSLQPMTSIPVPPAPFVPIVANPIGTQSIATYPLNVVGLEINGVDLIVPSGIPSAGQVPVALTGTTAAWQTLTETGNRINIQSYGTGVGAAKGVRLAASISSSSANLSISAGTKYTFAAGDVGKNIKVVGAGANASDLYTTIKTFTNSTNVVLNANASTGVSSVTAVWWTAGQDTTDRQALEAAVAAQDTESGVIYCPEAFYLYDQTPNLSANTYFKGIIGDGIRSTIWAASNASAGTFISLGTAPRWETIGYLSIYGPGYIPASLITNVALTSNVGTVTASQSFAAGQVVMLQLMITANGKLLNHLPATVISSGLSGSQFEFNYTHANIGSTADTGICYVQESGILVTGSMWFGKLIELEIYGFQGNGIQLTKPILSNLERVWVHNCGAAGYNIFTPQSSAVGATGTTFTNCYALGCYGPGFITYYCQESVFTNCYAESCGGGWIHDFSEGVVHNGCAVEQPIYQNATLPGKFIELRGGRSFVSNGGFWIMDSGGNAAQTYIACNTNGTLGSACQQHSFINPYLTTSGNTPTYIIACEDATCDWITVYEPFWTSGNISSSTQNLGVGKNNSLIYKSDEIWEGRHTITITSNSGNSAILAQSPTLATNGTNITSPDIVVAGNYWNGSTNAQDKLKIRAIPNSNASNPLMNLDFAHLGSSGGWQITVGGVAIISSTAQWIGQINTSASVTMGTIAVGATTASGLITANAGLTITSGQKLLNATPHVENSPGVTASNFAISGGWGASPTGPTVQANSYNAAGRVNVVPGGAGITANPTVTFTYASDTNSNTPILILQDESPNTADAANLWVITAIDSSHAVVTYKGTPTSSRTYAFAWQMVFRG